MTTSTPDVQVRRAYDAAGPQDGTRVLVDRLWPRGLKKVDAGFDEWCQDVSPSTELRRWYGHEPQKFEDFRHRYLSELQEPTRAEALRHLHDLAVGRRLTLVTATKRVDISAAAVLAHLLRG
ncbi:MAG: DUF488 family protein [Lapillicoccus sp.]